MDSRPLKLPSLAKRRKLARALEAKFQSQLRLLVEMAAAYHHEGRPVPPEVGEAIGAVEHRRRAFEQVQKVLLETSSGIGIRPFVERFLADIDRDAKAVARLLALRAAS
jgi:hypothetical protein